MSRLGNQRTELQPNADAGADQIIFDSDPCHREYPDDHPAGSDRLEMHYFRPGGLTSR